MSFVKRLSLVEPNTRYKSVISNQNTPVGTSDNVSSILPEVYSGYPQRIDRYGQYDQMDTDPEVAIALNTIAEFSTQPNPDDPNEVFKLNFNQEPTETELKIIKQALHKWTLINKFKQRIWRIFRDTIKYGDQIFIRDPDTNYLYWVNPADVNGVVVNTAKGKVITDYLIRNLEMNVGGLTLTPSDQYGSNIQGIGTNTLDNNMNANRYGNIHRYGQYSLGNENATAVDAKYVLHLSLTEDLDAGWPFATSILESVYKVYRQKELLEDAVIIYRIIRAPERRVFYVDVGDVPEQMAARKVERFKNELRQRKLPQRSQVNGSTVVDASYNPMSSIEDIFIPVTPDGRGAKVDTLPGGQSLGTIDDLLYFNQKLIRGLMIPASYIPSGTTDTNIQFTDGKSGVAMIQEFRFSEYCKRFQRLLEPSLDQEFKIFLANIGAEIDSNLFELGFHEPQHFTQSAKAERDAALVGTFTSLVDVPFISRYKLLKDYLGWTDEDIAENESKWIEENFETLKSAVSSSALSNVSSGGQPGMDSIGLRPEDEINIESETEEPPEPETTEDASEF